MRQNDIFKDLPDIVRRLAAGFEASGVALALFDPQDEIAHASSNFRRLWDVQPEARSFGDIMRHCHASGTGPVIATSDIDGWLDNAGARRRSVPERAFEIDMRDGRWFWVSETTFADGWLMLTAIDITSLKANERTLTKARDDALVWAETDVLTGLGNRRHAMGRLVQAIEQARMSGTSLNLALIDIDHFKMINDGHGHDIGDRVLEHFARLGNEAIRKGDLLARVGGEEFLLLLPDTPIRNAHAVIERMRAQVEQSWPVGLAVLRYTMSAGLVQLLPGEGAQKFYRRADQALYRAKETGRNRIEVVE